MTDRLAGRQASGWQPLSEHSERSGCYSTKDTTLWNSRFVGMTISIFQYSSRVQYPLGTTARFLYQF